MFSILRKLIGILRGGAGAREIVIGITLGFMIGMLPGVSLTLAIGIVLVLVLNGNVAMVLFAFAFGKLTCLALSALTFRIGFFLVHASGLEGIVQACSRTPILALMNLDNYCLVGGLPIGLVVGPIIGSVVAFIVTSVRVKLLEARENSEKLDKLTKNLVVRIVMRVVLGKKKGDMKEGLEKKSPFFRKKGLIVAGVVLSLTLGLEFLFLQFAAKPVLERYLTRSNGAEVNIGKLRLSILKGEAVIRDFQVADRKNLNQNAFEAEEMTFDFGFSDLLAKRIYIDKLAVGRFKFDVPRRKPGKLYVRSKDDKEDEDEDEADKDADTRDFLENLFTNRERYEQYARRSWDLVKRIRKIQKRNTELQSAGDPTKRIKQLKEIAKREGSHFSLSARPWLIKQPNWLIRNISVGDISVGDSLPKQRFVLADLSSAPSLHDKPVILSLEPEAGGLPTFGIELHSEDEKAADIVQLNLIDVPLGKDIAFGDKVPLKVEDGAFSVQIKGLLGESSLDLPFSLQVKGLKAAPRPGKKILGLEDETARQVFDALKEISFSGTVYGRPKSLKFKIDEDEARKALQDALTKAGKKALAAKVNEQWERGKRKAKDKIAEKIKEEFEDKYGDELRRKLGDENADKIMKTAHRVLGEDGVDAAANYLKGLATGEKQPKDGKEKKPGETTDRALDAAVSLFGNWLEHENKKREEKDKKKGGEGDKDNQDAKKKKRKKRSKEAEQAMKFFGKWLDTKKDKKKGEEKE